MTSSKHLRSVLFLSLTLSLLTACPPPNTSETPEPTVQASDKPEKPTTPPSTGTPTQPLNTSNLTLEIQGEAGLEKFVVAQENQGICLNDLKSVDTVITVSEALSAEVMAALKALGVTVDGQTLTLNHPVSNIAALIKGFKQNLPNLPLGMLKGTVNLNNSAGNSMGSLSFTLDYKTANQSFKVFLKAAGDTLNPKGCIPLIPELTGATLSATAGGLMKELPATTPSQPTGSEPTPAPPSDLPAGLAAVKLNVDNRYLTAIGETRQLGVKLFDAAGKELSQEGVVIEWSSNRPEDLSIDSQGKITALVGLGYGEITAKVSGTSFSDKVLFDITDPSFFTTPVRRSGSSSSQNNEPDLIGEFRISSELEFDQDDTSVAMDDEGNFVVVWESDSPGPTQDGSYAGVYAQRYDSNGKALGDEFQVNTYTISHQDDAAVAMDSDGNFVIVWESNGQDGSNDGIFARRYDSSGNALDASEFQVNTVTSSNQDDPDVAMDEDGNFVITWESNGQDGYGDGVFARRYDSSGNALDASEFQVNTHTTDDQADPSVAMDANGNFVVVWESYNQDGDYYGVYARRYDSNGNALDASEFQVNTFNDQSQDDVDVAIDGDGNFVVVWESYEQDGDYNGIYARRYDSSGNALDASEFQVNTYTTDAQSDPSVAMDGDGNFVITWESDGQDGSDTGVFARQYDSNGNALGSEFPVNTETSGAQDDPDVAMDADGNLVVIWESFGQDGFYDGVYGQRYDADGDAL